MLEKSRDESWLYFLSRVAADLFRDKSDWQYWAHVFAMIGAASLAVAFIQGDGLAWYVGIAFCLYGLRLNRRT